MKRQQLVWGAMLLSVGLLLQGAIASESNPFTRLKASYRTKLDQIDESAEKQKQSVMNQVAVRLDRIVLHYQQSGNYQLSFEAQNMVNRIRDGEYHAINPAAFSSDDLKGFYAKVDQALKDVDVRKVEELKIAKNTYISDLEDLIVKLNNEGSVGVAGIARTELRSIKNDVETAKR